MTPFDRLLMVFVLTLSSPHESDIDNSYTSLPHEARWLLSLNFTRRRQRYQFCVFSYECFWKSNLGAAESGALILDPGTIDVAQGAVSPQSQASP